MLELQKYCENDTIGLYQILIKFQSYIYKLFTINITKYPTIPSLSFAIYRSNFMNENTIPIIQTKLHNIIKQSYFGGITEAYKPCGKNLRSYDINSLYPFSMSNFEMPTGTPRYVKGDLKNIQDYLEKDSEHIPFGFFNVNVETPKEMDKPFLPKRHTTANGMRTIFPLGE